MDSKQLRKLYLPLAPKLKNALEYVKSQFSDLPPSEFSLEANLKSYPSIKRKMEDHQIRDPQELSDLARGRLYFSDQFQFPEVIEIVKHLFGDKLIGIDKKTAKSQKHGLEYHGVIHLALNIDGVKFELQLMPNEFKPYQDLLHDIYEKLRNPKLSEKLSDLQKNSLRKMNNKLYKTLEKKSKEARSSA
jgi:hypothetical protein